MSDDFITVRIPEDHWEQIVSDIENMCGDSKENIEILADAWIVRDISYPYGPNGRNNV